MQELTTKETVRQKEAVEKRVRIFLQSSFYLLDGNWQWEMETDAVFCSDVMISLQENFAGTKAIFHPDDVPALKELLFAGQPVHSLQFRIITTYGEVKTLTGENIALQEEAQQTWPQKGWQTALKEREQKAAHTHLQLLREVDEKTSRFSGAGRWYYNAATHQTWYSDFVYQLHGLPAQALNAHLHTFHAFIHPGDRELVLEYTDKAFRNKLPLHVDYRIVAAGKEKWIAYKAQWFYSERGEPVLGGVFQDISGQKQIENELQDRKNRLQFQRQQSLYSEQQVNFGHWQIGLLTRKATYSDQCYRIFGVKPQGIAPTIASFLNYVHPDDREMVENAYRQILNENTVSELEYRIVRNDGKIRHVLQKARLLQDENELVVSGIIQDITVQRMLEKKLAGLNDTLQLNALLAQQSDEQANLVSWIMDLEENSIRWSDSFSKLTGHAGAQLSSATEKTLFSFVHPHDLKEFRQQWNLAVQERQEAAFAFRFLFRGAVQFLKAAFRIYRHNDKDYFIGTLQNTTAEQVLQQQLSQRVQLAESLSENTLDRVMITDVHNTVQFWNRACELSYGIKKADVLGENFFVLFPQLKTEENLQLLQRVQRGEKVLQEGLAANLSKGYFNRYLMPVYQGSEVSGVLHIVHDVTKETELRNNLHDRLQLIEGLVQSSVDRIIALDRNLNYLYWNKKAEEYYGIPKEQVLHKNILEVFRGLVNDPSYNEIRKALRGETVHLPVNPEAEAFFETYLIPIKDEKGAVISLLWMAHDLNREYQLTKERTQAANLLQATMDASKDMIQVFEAVRNENGEIVDFKWILNNESAKETYGDIIGKSLLAFNPGVVEEGIFDTFKQVVETGIPDQSERHYVHEQFNGWFYQSTVKLNDGVATTTTDITKRKMAEQAVLTAKEELQAVLDSSLYVIQAFKAVRDNTGKIVDFVWTLNNKEAVEQNEDVIGKSLLQKHPGVVPSGLFDQFVQVTETGIAVDQEIYYNYEQFDGWFHQTLMKMDDGFVMSTENITEKKKAAQEILRLKDEIAQKATDKYYSLFNSIDEGFCIVEMLYDEAGKAYDYRFVEANESFERQTGLQNVVGRTEQEVGPGSEPYWMELYDKVAQTGEAVRFEQYHQTTAHWYDAYVSRVDGAGSRQVAIVFNDVTQRRKAEEALRESEERQTFLLKLSDALRPLSNPVAIQETATHVAMEHFGCDRCYYSEIEGDQSIIRQDAAREGLASVTGVYSLRDIPVFKTVMDEGKPFIVQDVNTTDLVDESLRQLCLQLQVISFIDIPVIKNGKPVGLLSVVQSTPRAWTGFEIQLAEEVAERTWAAVERAKAETALEESEEQLRAFSVLLEQQVAERTKELQKNLAVLQHTEALAQTGSWEYDIATGNFYWSEGMYRLFELPYGSPVQPEIYLEFAAEEDRTIAKRIFKDLKKNQQSFEETLRIKTRSGLRMLRIKASLVQGEKGEAERIIGVDLDITDIKEAEEKIALSQHWLEQTALASPDAITVYDLQTKKPVYLNNCLGEWIGTTSEELVNRGIDGRLQLIHADDRLRLLHFQEKIKAAGDGEILKLEYRLYAKNGTVLWIRNRSKVFLRDEQGRVTHILSILQDMTEEKAAERMLKELNASLEKRNAELESKNEEITSFAFVASHDLREPLRKIYTFSDWLLTRETSLSETGRLSAEKLFAAVKRLNLLINDILALTKVHAGNERVKTVDLNRLLLQVKEEMQEKLHKTRSVIEAGPLPFLTGAVNQLFFLFKNLLDNALKFQPPGNRPHVRIHAENDGNFFKLSFTDNGLGIAKEHYKKIFEMFRRLQNREEYEGTGMGLAICKKIMEKHGGSISVDSEPGKGTTFTCWFPAVLSADPAALS